MENLKVKNDENGITEMLAEDENGIRQGKYFKYENGKLKEEGNYKDGEKDGKWIYYIIDQERSLLQKEVNYKNGQLDGEYKSFYLYGGIKEEGQYLNDLKEGEWKEYYEDGELKEKSNYKENKLDGNYWLDSKEFELKGQYLNDLKEGEWLKKNNLSWEKVEYKNGIRNGKYSSLTDDLYDIISVKGQYLNDLKEGEWVTSDGYKNIIEQYKGGQKDEIIKIERSYNYSFGKLNENGREEGEWTTVSKNNGLEFSDYGKIVANYKNGQLDGEYKLFSKSGQLEKEGYYKEGRQLGEWKEYKDGFLLETVYYTEEFKPKIYREWHKTGNLAIEKNYDDLDKKIGTYKEYWDNGKLKEEGNFKDDKKDGKWSEYDITGKKLIEKTYIDGELISEKPYKESIIDSIKNIFKNIFTKSQDSPITAYEVKKENLEEKKLEKVQPQKEENSNYEIKKSKVKVIKKVKEDELEL